MIIFSEHYYNDDDSGHENDGDGEELTYCGEHDLRNAKRNHNPPSRARTQPTHVSTLSWGGTSTKKKLTFLEPYNCDQFFYFYNVLQTLIDIFHVSFIDINVFYILRI